MKSIKRILKTQPPTIYKRVDEVEVGGPIGRWFHKHNWGAMTIPFPFFVLIMYWSSEDAPDGEVHPLVRVHEFTHVAQDQLDRFWFVSWAKYLWWLFSGVPWKKVFKREMGIIDGFMDSYYHVPYEQEAYAVEQEAEENGLPAWAK